MRIDFKTVNFQDFYNEKLVYKTEKFILNGEVDFVISTGLRRALIPYFFIQAFKRSEEYGNPRPQLLVQQSLSSHKTFLDCFAPERG